MSRHTRTVRGIPHRPLCVGMLVSIALGRFAVTAQAQSCTRQWIPGDPVPGIGGAVNTLTTWDPDDAGPQSEVLVIGGRFEAAGDALANSIATWNGSTWAPIGTGPTSLSIYASCVSGGLLTVAGITTNSATLSVEGFVSQWDGAAWHQLGGRMTNPSGTPLASALAVFNGELIVAGQFTSIGGTPISNIARWNGTTWVSLGDGLNARAYALAVFNGELIAGGAFTTAGSVAASRVAQWNGTSWSPLGDGIVGPDASAKICALTRFQEKLVVGGYFNSAGGSPANGIAAWTGTGWEAMGPGVLTNNFDRVVSALGTNGGNLYAGGNFLIPGDPALVQLAQWTGTEWTVAGRTPSSAGGGSIVAIARFGGRTIAGGYFRALSGTTASNIATLDGGAWSALSPGTDGPAYALLSNGDELIVGGEFESIQGKPFRHIARCVNEEWTAMGTGLQIAVRSIVVLDNEIYACGYLPPSYAGSAANVSKWTGTEWTPLAGSINGAVFAACASGGKLVVGGSFSTIGGVSASRVAQWNGTAWQSLGTGTSGSVFALRDYQGSVIAGGNFFTAGGVVVSNIARWNGAAWQKLGVGMDSSVLCLAEYAGQLIAAGNFSSAGGSAAQYIARWNGTAWQSLAGNAASGIQSLTVYNGELIAGGSSIAPDGTECRNVGRWSGTGWLRLENGISSLPYALTTHHSELIAAGDFVRAGSNVASAIAHYGCPLSIYAQPQSVETCAGGSATLSVGAAGISPRTYQWRRGSEILSDNDRFSGTSTAHLQIAPADEGDSGGYHCVVSNSSGSIDSSPAQLLVAKPASGDGNYDTVVNGLDIQKFVCVMSIATPNIAAYCVFDLNGDGAVDATDAALLVNVLLGA